MNSSFVCISTILNSKIDLDTLVSFLNELSSKALCGYLQLNSIYEGKSNKKRVI